MIRALFAALVLWLAPALAGAAELRQGRTAHYDFEWSPGLDGFAGYLMEEVEAQHARIYAALGADPEVRSQITLVDDVEAMTTIVRERGLGQPPEWAAGLAYPRLRQIYLQASPGRDELFTTLQHEIVHVALGVATDDARVPRWFHEGVAIRLSEGAAFERIRLLTEAALMDGLIDLDELDRGFPAGASRAGTAYAQAVHFVGYLREQYGDDRFRSLIANLRESDTTFPAAVERAFAEPLASIEQKWRGDLRVWWGWIPVVFGATTLWVAAALLLVGAWRRRRRQYQRRLALLEAQESEASMPEIHVAGTPPPPMRRPPLHDPYDGRPPTIH